VGANALWVFHAATFVLVSEKLQYLYCAVSDKKFPNHYPKTYSTHGETMLIFQAMPFYKPDAFCLGSDIPWIVL
jgi:heme/copper-type cytochrome/quinol oxidase subunit 1